MKKIIYLFAFLIPIISMANTDLSYCETTTITGKLTDAATGESIGFGTIAFFQNDVLQFGVETDTDGRYHANIEAGTYNIEASYIGYQPQMQTGVVIKAGQVNTLDFAISEGVLMDAVEIVEYKVPLIEIQNTTSGATITASEIQDVSRKRARNLSSVGSDSAPPSIPNSDNEVYSEIIENKPLSPFRAPLSTFAIDVDRASYSNVRRFLENGKLPPKDAVRIEEMINYFNYDYPSPKTKTRPFAVYTEVISCPWNVENKLLHIGLQGRKIDIKDYPASNLVFLIDVSGSMGNYNKLPLVKKSFRMLVDNLREEDYVSIVTYAGHAGILLESTSARDKTKIMEAIDALGAGGSTAGAQGITTAYDLARKNFKQDGNNRVILATDGDFNVGIHDNDSLLKLIEKERNSGVFLSILGYGMGNYRDDKMQILANAGNGNHAYIVDLDEARKVLVTEFGGTMHTIAKDVKVQVEFNPAYVQRYRLIGYENRMLKAEDFRNDEKDAGEIGSGHSVTAIYEITPNRENFDNIDDKLIYQKRSRTLEENKEMATIRLRYKTPTGHKAWEFDKKVSHITTLEEKVEDRTRHAAAIAEFGLLLRDSQYKGDASYSNVMAALQALQSKESHTKEVVQLVQMASDLDKPK